MKKFDMKKKVILLVLVLSVFATCFLTGASDGPCNPEMDFALNDAKHLLAKGENNFIADVTASAVYKVYCYNSDGNAVVASSKTYSISIYSDKDYKDEIKPIIKYNTNGYTGKAIYYRFHSSDDGYVYVKINAYVKGLTFKSVINTDSIKQNNSYLKTETTGDGNKVVQSYMWISMYNQVSGLNKNTHHKIVLNHDVKVYDYIVYLNSIDTQILYGLIKYLTTGSVMDGLKTATVNALNAMKNNSSDVEQKINTFKTYFNQNKGTIFAYAFNKASKLTSWALEKVGEELISKILTAYVPAKLLKGLFGIILEKVIIDKAADSLFEVPTLTLELNAFDRVIEFIESKFKSAINSNKNGNYTCFSKGITIKKGIYYWGDTNRTMDMPPYNLKEELSLWNDAAKSSNVMYGALGQKGWMISSQSFIPLNDIGGVNSVYKILANSGGFTFK